MEIDKNRTNLSMFDFKSVSGVTSSSCNVDGNEINYFESVMLLVVKLKIAVLWICTCNQDLIMSQCYIFGIVRDSNVFEHFFFW